MDKKEWQRHIAGVLADAVDRGELPAGRTEQEAVDYTRRHILGCPACVDRARTKRANANRRARDDAHRACGLVRTPYGWE